MGETLNSGVIYKLTSPSGGVYIGQSINIERRHAAYKRKNCKDQSALYNAILKYGFENFTVDILFETEINENTKNTLDEMEIYYISFYDSMNNGYNCTTGGFGGKKSNETLERMRIARTNPPIETRIKMSESAKKRKYSKEGLIKMSNCQKKPISQFSLSGEFISNWPSSSDASIALGISQPNISNCCCGRIKNAGGYTWKHNINKEKQND